MGNNNSLPIAFQITSNYAVEFMNYYLSARIAHTQHSITALQKSARIFQQESESFLCDAVKKVPNLTLKLQGQIKSSSGCLEFVYT